MILQACRRGTHGQPVPTLCPEGAQHDSPGQRPGYRVVTNQRALKGRTIGRGMGRDGVSPFQGLIHCRVLRTPEPRALPGAFMFLPR
jgi:hypothetical protein